MNFVVIGTDHTFQSGEPGLEGLLCGWLGKQLIEPFQAVAEEYGDKIGESIGQHLALGGAVIRSDTLRLWAIANAKR